MFEYKIRITVQCCKFYDFDMWQLLRCSKVDGNYQILIIQYRLLYTLSRCFSLPRNYHFTCMAEFCLLVTNVDMSTICVWLTEFHFEINVTNLCVFNVFFHTLYVTCLMYSCFFFFDCFIFNLKPKHYEFTLLDIKQMLLFFIPFRNV